MKVINKDAALVRDTADDDEEEDDNFADFDD